MTDKTRRMITMVREARNDNPAMDFFSVALFLGFPKTDAENAHSILTAREVRTNRVLRQLASNS